MKMRKYNSNQSIAVNLKYESVFKKCLCLSAKNNFIDRLLQNPAAFAIAFYMDFIYMDQELFNSILYIFMNTEIQAQNNSLSMALYATSSVPEFLASL